MRKWFFIAGLIVLAVGLWFGLTEMIRRSSSSRLAQLPDLTGQPVSLVKHLADRDQAARREPDSAQSVGLLGMAYHSDIFYDQASICYARAHELDAKDWRWHYYPALILAELGSPAAASEELLAALALNPDYAPAWFRLGQAYGKLGKAEQAEKAYRRVLDLARGPASWVTTSQPSSRTFPIEAYATLELARLIEKQGRSDQAIQILEPLMSKHPAFGPAGRLLARAYQGIGRISEAADLRARMSGLVPYHPPADIMVDGLVKESHSATFLLKQLGLARQGLSRPWAEFVAQRAIEVDPQDADAVVALGLLMLEYARPNEALPHLDRFRELKPDDYQTMNNIGAILSRYGKLAKASQYSLEAIRVNPKCAEAYSNLGMNYSMQGRQAEARKFLLKALKLKPGNAEVLTNLGTVAGRQREFEPAKDYYRKALKKDASFAAAHFGLGLLLAAQAEWSEAITHYRRALKIRPDDINTLERLAWLLATCPAQKFRDGIQAVDLAKRANSMSGGRDVRYLNTLAAAYAEAGEFEKARQTAKIAVTIAQAGNVPGQLERLQARLSLYEKDQAYHLPIVKRP